MGDPTLALQGAIVALLKADAAVAALLADRVYDRVPTAPTKPYLRYSGDQVVPDKAECLDAVEVYVTLDVWSEAAGKPEAKRIVGAVVSALDGVALDLGTGLSLNLIEHHGTRYLDDEDMAATHAVLTFRALVDPA